MYSFSRCNSCLAAALVLVLCAPWVAAASGITGPVAQGALDSRPSEPLAAAPEQPLAAAAVDSQQQQQQQQQQAQQQQQQQPYSAAPPPPPPRRLLNLAALSDGAAVLAVNPEARKPERTLDKDEDSFMKNDCAANKWIMVELSQLGTVESVRLTNKELYSSRVRNFRVRGRQSHPRRDGPDLAVSLASDAWEQLGDFTADNKRGTQTFALPMPKRVRYVLFEFLTHYGTDSMCALNSIEVLGVSAAQELEEALGGLDEEVLSAPAAMSTASDVSAAVPAASPWDADAKAQPQAQQQQHPPSEQQHTHAQHIQQAADYQQAEPLSPSNHDASLHSLPLGHSAAINQQHDSAAPSTDGTTVQAGPASAASAAAGSGAETLPQAAGVGTAAHPELEAAGAAGGTAPVGTCSSASGGNCADGITSSTPGKRHHPLDQQAVATTQTPPDMLAASASSSQQWQEQQHEQQQRRPELSNDHTMAQQVPASDRADDKAAIVTGQPGEQPEGNAADSPAADTKLINSQPNASVAPAAWAPEVSANVGQPPDGRDLTVKQQHQQPQQPQPPPPPPGAPVSSSSPDASSSAPEQQSARPAQTQPHSAAAPPAPEQPLSVLNGQGSGKPKQAGNLFDVIKSEMVQLKVEQSKMARRLEAVGRRNEELEALAASLQHQNQQLHAVVRNLEAGMEDKVRRQLRQLLQQQGIGGTHGFSTTSGSHVNVGGARAPASAAVHLPSCCLREHAHAQLAAIATGFGMAALLCLGLVVLPKGGRGVRALVVAAAVTNAVLAAVLSWRASAPEPLVTPMVARHRMLSDA